MTYSTSALYQRHPQPQLNQRLSREGLKIFHVCKEPLEPQEIAARSGLPLGTALASIQKLIDQKVLRVYSEPSAPVESTLLDDTSESATPTPTEVGANVAAPQKLKTFKLELFDLLEPKLGKNAAAHLGPLEAAQDAVDLEQTARRLALKLKLTVDKQTGEALEHQLSDMFGKS